MLVPTFVLSLGRTKTLYLPESSSKVMCFRLSGVLSLSFKSTNCNPVASIFKSAIASPEETLYSPSGVLSIASSKIIPESSNQLNINLRNLSTLRD